MNKPSRTLFCAVCTLTLSLGILLPGAAAVKMAPPAEIVEMFTILSLVEEHFESKEYDEAQAHMLQGKDTLKKVLPLLEKKSSQIDLENFKKAYVTLFENIQYYDTEFLQKSYIELNQSFLKLIDIYEFKIPPFLIRINTYLTESVEALEKEDYVGVDNELDEIAELFDTFSNKLTEKGAVAKDLEAFASSVSTAKKMVASKEKEAIEKELNELQRLTDQFNTLFHLTAQGER